jgi:hypothetical protein
MEELKCVACIVETKLNGLSTSAALYGTRDEPPTVREAVAILNGQTTCAEHIVVHQQSSLAAPNGAPLMIPGR